MMGLKGLGSFTELLWVNATTKAVWEPRLEAVHRAVTAAEIESVVRGLRGVAVGHLSEGGIAEQLSDWVQRGLTFVPIRKVKSYSGFAHRHEDPKPGDSWMVYGALCLNPDDGLRFKAFHGVGLNAPGDHKAIGKMLGYPECCQDFFQATFVERRIADPIYEQMAGVDAVPPWAVKVEGYASCNAALRYFGIRLAPHLPCAADCRETEAWVKAVWLPLIESIGGAAIAEDLLFLLEMPLRWSGLKGVAMVDTPLFRGITNSVICWPERVVEWECINPVRYNVEAIMPWTMSGSTEPWSRF